VQIFSSSVGKEAQFMYVMSMDDTHRAIMSLQPGPTKFRVPVLGRIELLKVLAYDKRYAFIS